MKDLTPSLARYGIKKRYQTKNEQMKDLTPETSANKPIFGELPRNKQMLVNAWIELHKEELMANWHAGRLSGEFFKLDPLR